MLFLEKLEQKWKSIVCIMIICILLGIIYSLLFIEKENFSASTILLVKTQKNEDNEIQNNGNLELTDKLVETFEEIIKSDSTIGIVKSDLELPESNANLNSKITVNKVSNSDTFEIKVKYKNSNIAIQINEELIKSFSSNIKTIYANTEIFIVDSPHIEEKVNVSAIVVTNITFVLLGIIINLAYITILVCIDKNVKNGLDVETELSLKVLGKVPLKKFKVGGKVKNNSELIAYESEKSNLSKSFKTLKSNIQFVNVNNKGKNIILVTSPNETEGKSFITANIAISFAEVGKKVILIDADMINGRIGKMFNVPNNLGLSNYLSGLDTNGVEINELINKFINETTIKNLNIITSGTVPPNSSELLTTSKLREMIKDLSVFYDVVILDGTSILITTDALILTRISSSTILVADYKKTKKDDLWKAKRDIQNVGGRIIGVVLNKVKIKENKSNETILVEKKKTEKIKNKLKEKINKFKAYLEEKKYEKSQKLLEAAKTTEMAVQSTEVIAQNNEIVNKTVDKNSEVAVNVQPEINVKKENKNIQENFENQENNEIKEKVNLTFEKVKEKYIYIKEKIIVIVNNLSEKIKSKITEIKEKNVEKAKAKEEMLKEEIAREKINLSKEIIKENSHNETENVLENKLNEANNVSDNKLNNANNLVDNNLINTNIEEKSNNKIINNKEISKINNSEINLENKIKDNNSFIDYDNSELYNSDSGNTILVIVDAENGYCRVFSQYCFTEKLIRGIDKNDGFVKAHYSSNLLKRRKLGLMENYGLNQKQVDRIDSLIYTTLSDYDDCIWLERKTASHKADEYVKCMAKEYEKMPDESQKDYIIRCQHLRKFELLKSQIEIEYKLENILKTNHITLTDKIELRKFAKLYDINNLKHKKIYNEINQENNETKKNVIQKCISLLQNIKVEQVRVKSVEELEKEVSELQKKQKDLQEQTFYRTQSENNYSNLNEYEREELAIQEEQKKLLYEQKIEQERIKQEKREKKLQERINKKQEKIKRREETRKNKEIEKQKAKEEARIEEELLVDNLYPKTKNNKNL
jgi:capsular exopolysaccharide synthesis family protein